MERDIAADAGLLAEEVKKQVLTATEVTKAAEAMFDTRKYGREVLKYLNENLEQHGLVRKAGNAGKTYYICVN